jgi:hypothetical protein
MPRYGAVAVLPAFNLDLPRPVEHHFTARESSMFSFAIEAFYPDAVTVVVTLTTVLVSGALHTSRLRCRTARKRQTLRRRQVCRV